MKAAVIYPNSGLPQYAEIPEPQVQNEDEVLVTVKAVAVKQLDKSIASGKHYSSGNQPATSQVPGIDGMCLLDDGRRVYGMGVSGMMAEKAIIHRNRIVQIPDGLNDAMAAALPNAVIGAAMALKFKAKIQAGDIVLVNGATGVTGRMAIQLARHYGAKKIIGTGRNQESLSELLALGADETIAITGDDAGFVAQLEALHKATPIGVVIDYLWGRTAELILSVLKGNGIFTNPVSYVSVGSMSGDLIQLSAAILRSVDLQLTGSGMGSWPRQHVAAALTEILPEAFRLAAEGKLKLETITAKLSDISSVWQLDVSSGNRLVVTV
ncbi:NADPH:quinone reductase-like Zn-dependent oxidoreductase [Dyadobacter sp. BE34]|uniref:NADPH:quinone reductase-like Zn-dependent oxidoreductase n=1 Tax=Dyadobacter fermentans TaxID=94254 RepID=A0ABU1QXW2_9BACT|nr:MULTISPECIES: zinc-binding alcohol dehydrogenase family protein [Dyadobacter]MDR6805999.1 NADPH:quinone reductase-like Zn-dependent oxidoreductase [Dyadobacter fermentans]MDR7043739.1 NADPH:quinone reductase-like Zn-dependent oxidoreductase [Dyadobacter sp. BE242]MDR7198051.1 NADPH:quinone reductase-like Zn-dependent oxidoreductase [Dyadobacter sp. BE34]MDR7216013.1 NADPH:quinone reductase-like Zn-dependent oxidoreductase [Dyadobacter sp. BE31]MDR7264461.1 NADPH:quinone reductase-like Zn-de